MRGIYVILMFFFTTSLFWAQSTIKKDIEDQYLDKLYIKNDNTLATEFQRYAIDLFKKGQKINDTIFKDSNVNTVGVCIIHKLKDSVKQDIEFTLYALTYKDLRVKDRHRSFFYGKGKEGLSNFHINYHNDDQKEIINEAVSAYLKYDSIPRGNQAYQHGKTYKTKDVYYEKFFQTDKHSTVIIGLSYAYMRQNGNYIIQIEGFPDNSLDSDKEELYVTDHFVNDWYTISVFIIDDSNNKAYNKIFKY
jgi:hypothetical protein|nr:hypothetical protein [uncultured Psychroserpens sp.]